MEIVCGILSMPPCLLNINICSLKNRRAFVVSFGFILCTMHSAHPPYLGPFCVIAMLHISFKCELTA